MKRALAVMTALMLASACSALPAMGKDGGGRGNGAGNSSGGANGAAGGNGSSAPGQSKSDNHGARASAPGQTKAAPGSRAANAPAGLRSALSSIRAGSSALAEAGQNATVNLIDVDDIAGGNGRAVLNQALRDNRAKIQRLRAELEALNVIGLSGFDLDRVVATRVENDGSLTVFID